MGAMMRAGAAVAIVAVSIVGNSAWSACPPGPTHNCVDLGLVPQISQQVVASERLAAPAKTAPTAVQEKPYNGPTVGFDAMVRRAPTVGYHWSLD
jgi:hypothetical protein